MTGLLWLLAGFLGGTGTTLAVRRWKSRSGRITPPREFPAHAPHVIDLLRRAHDGAVACIVRAEADPLVARREERAEPAVVERVVAAAKLALGDGREHVLRNGDVVVAVGDGDLGGALGFPSADVHVDRLRAVGRELRQLLGELRVGRAEPGGLRSANRHVSDWLAVAPHTVAGVAHALCEAVQATTGRTAAVALRDQLTQTTMVTAVSHGGDRMLFGLAATADSAAGRACAGDIPVVGPTLQDLFGQRRTDRRMRQMGGTAFPLRDGREAVGALVVFGIGAEGLDAAVMERLMWLTVDAGPRLASALAVRAAETKALTDALTGLPNRRALDHAMAKWAGGSGALLCVDIDHFKQFNDGYGHVAGDAALKHVAQVFRRTLREHDLAARVGGEEFALWLPDTPLHRALEVAERVRQHVASAALHWNGMDLKITCSVGVAAMPDSVARLENLYGAADAALYQAKRGGRNRVQASLRRGGAS